MELAMPRVFAAILAFAFLTGAASAEPGGRGDLDQVRREVEAMQRDGRWDRLIAEGQANKQASQAPQQATQPVRAPTTGRSSRARPRQ
jgi:hypothetical protein